MTDQTTEQLAWGILHVAESIARETPTDGAWDDPEEWLGDAAEMAHDIVELVKRFRNGAQLPRVWSEQPAIEGRAWATLKRDKGDGQVQYIKVEGYARKDNKGLVTAYLPKLDMKTNDDLSVGTDLPIEGGFAVCFTDAA